MFVDDFNTVGTEQEINDFMNLFDLKNLVSEPMYIKSSSPRCIYLILTNRERNFQQATAV